MSFDVEQIREEIRHWFFDVYVPHGIALFNGNAPEGLRGFLQYWGTPLLFTRESQASASWLMTEEQLLSALKIQDDALKAAGYKNTPIPDSRVFVYNDNAGAVEVIWSRQNGDGQEIQRVAVHFEVARIDGEWLFVAIHSRLSDPAKDEGSLAKAWMQ
jgi:hypothetical protein